jgi:hypothetical protein
VGFALRVVSIDEGLFGDELFLYAIASRPRIGTVLTAVHDSESTPPLHFLLAWAAAKVGDPTVSVRLPSLLLGTAAIPLTYLVGLRALGRRAALLGAAFLALSPFAVFYAVEARAYAMLLFLSALSTLSLLLALQTRQRGWWLVYGLGSCLILYTHYTGAFLVVAQAAWAFWTRRERLRELVLVHTAIAIAYLPWLPAFLVQRQDSSANRIASFKSFTPEGSVRELTISLSGHPFEPLRDVPGRLAVALLVVGVALAIAGAVVVRLRRRSPPPIGPGAGPQRPATLVLVALVAISTPAGVALYSLVGENVYIPRNLSASLPAICLLLGAGLATLRKPLAAAGAAAVLVALAIGTATTLESGYGRPPYRHAAELVDARARSGDAVVEYPLFANYAEAGTFSFERSRSHVSTLLGHHLDVHFERPHFFLQARGYERSVWDRAARRRRLFVVLPWDAAHKARPPLPPRLRRRYHLVRREVWDGLVPAAAFEYARTRPAADAP